MRLWHKDIISVLPRQQLLGQWRECCCIASNISKNGSPNHVLVNKILDFDIEHFYDYSERIINEMKSRDYKVSPDKFWKHFNFPKNFKCFKENLFNTWHNERYLKQCLYNLQEKYDCGAISESEWNLLKPFLNEV